MGSVFAGMQIGLSRRVAVKTMHRHIATNSVFARRFHREALAVARLEHPNVVKIFDSGQDAATSTLYLVMELLQGESLGEWISRLAAPPPLSDVEDILQQVLDAFDVAHRVGIVHRDLKPDNIFLARDHAGRRVVKIVDFGIAHVDDAPDQGKDPTLTKEGSVAGTPAYMSPEQCRSLAVGPSTDLYAVGCVLTVLLQLRPPFSANTIMDLMTHQLFMPPPSLERPLGSEPVPPLLDRLRLDLLAKLPADRPPTAAAARALLAEAFSPEAQRERLPPRKMDEPLGAREERAEKWERTKETKPDVPPVNVGTHIIGLVRAGAAQDGVGDTCITGLAAHQIFVRPLRTGEAPPPVVIFDIGHDIAAGHAWLAELSRVSPTSKGIIAMADVTTDGINALIEAGAAHVQPYPIRPDALAKVVGRILRRRR
jgi:serine/threonine-protein kinase